MKAPRLAVVGLGLIGGSLARALRSAGAVSDITGFDTDARQSRLAVELGVIDRSADNAAAAVGDADVVVLAVPVLRTAEVLHAIQPGLRKGAIVTDVGSTKQSVLADAHAVFGAIPSWFVAGHPIAGTEKSGVAHSVADLFHNHRVILTPHAAQDRRALTTITALWSATGARVVEMEAAQHDAVFAATSHLPHVLAYSFVDMLARLDTGGEIFPNAGGGFRDFTRIASSSPDMWHDIVRANAEAVGHLLEQQIGELREILGMIRGGRWDDVRRLFERARSARERHLAQIE
ncbi:MAG TPA: prephenate dehydrogenase/arogenate dehydrogenase family protein [Verrucomicrobiae bacterium]|nr:prephenate dehydrogenase/arogenate dehydrogenase family protein [Verrucomicrobiae bacterium]